MIYLEKFDLMGLYKQLEILKLQPTEKWNTFFSEKNRSRPEPQRGGHCIKIGNAEIVP